MSIEFRLYEGKLQFRCWQFLTTNIDNGYAELIVDLDNLWSEWKEVPPPAYIQLTHRPEDGVVPLV